MGINEELRQERILASYERTVERLEAEVAKLLEDIHSLQVKYDKLWDEAAKLQADRANLKREINFKDNVIHIAAERENKLVELVRDSWDEAARCYCDGDDMEVKDYEDSFVKRRLDEITGGDTEGGGT